MLLMQALTSCTSCPKSENNNLVWFPVPDPIVDGENVLVLVHEGETITAKENGVFVPFWYWQSVELYMITTEANIEKLNPS